MTDILIYNFDVKPFDFKKALDSVSHPQVNNETTCLWIADFLYMRLQVVK